MNLTVLCVFVQGHVAFTPEYVVRLHSMVARRIRFTRFLCLTDRPESLPDHIETVRIPSPRGVYGWWSKLELFNPTLPVEGRLMYLDLDVLAVRRLDEVAYFPAPFALVPDGAPNFRPKDGRKVVKRFNSSVMVWDAGLGHDLYTEWTRTEAQRLWGDQDWIGERYPGAAAMPREWFPRLSEVAAPPRWPEEARVILCKKPKNLDAAAKWEWFNEEWQ